MNPHLAQLQPYPFEKLRALFAGVTPNPEYKEIKLSIGEPQHATPQFIMDALAGGLKGLANAMEGIYFAKGTLASRREQLMAMNADQLTDTVFEIAQHTYEAKEAA